MKERIFALGLAIALLFNTVDFSTVAAAAAEVTQTGEEQVEEQSHMPDEAGKEEADPGEKGDAAGSDAKSVEGDNADSEQGTGKRDEKVNRDVKEEGSDENKGKASDGRAAEDAADRAEGEVNRDKQVKENAQQENVEENAEENSYAVSIQSAGNDVTVQEHKHDFAGGVCGTCGKKIVARVSSNFYVSLNEAFAQAVDGETISVLEALPEESLTYNYSNKSVTLDGLNYHWLASSSNGAILTVSAGTLMLTPMGDDTPIAITNNGNGYAVSVSGGTLQLSGKATLEGGLQVTGDGKLEGGMKEGSILTKGNGITVDERLYSVSVCDTVNNSNSKVYNTVLDLLDDGLAFAAYNKDTKTSGNIVRADTVCLSQDVIVVKHAAHDYDTSGVCACGAKCEHKNDDGSSAFEGGKCTVCEYVCEHPSDKVTEANGVYVCDVCGQQMVVKVKNVDTTTYYAKNLNNHGADQTLDDVFKNAPNDSTITLLEDDLCAAEAEVSGGKTITLDLNGKMLTESAQGITVGGNASVSNKLIVTGEGGSKNSKGSDITRAFRVREGGELVFNEYFGGTFDTVCVEGGTLTSTRETKDVIKIATLEIGTSAKISFMSGTFDKISFIGNSSVKLGDLLAEGKGNAFRYTTGNKAFVLYNAEITESRPAENVTITRCCHDSVTNSTCDYCGMKHIVAACINDNGFIGTYAAATDSPEVIKTVVNRAFDGWNDNGGTLKLFMDVAFEDRTITNKYAEAIDLNGHKITGGTLTLNNGGAVTIADESKGKKGSFTNVTVNGGASLTVDSVSVGEITAADKTAKITLKEGSKFSGYTLPAGMALADWIEDGYCVKNSNENTSLDSTGTAEPTGNFVVTKAPATIIADSKSGEVAYGEKVPTNLLPTITSTDSTIPDYYYYVIKWYGRMAAGTRSLGSGTLKNETFQYNNDSNADFSSVSAGDTLDVFCTITAYWSEEKTPLWQTVVKGYALKVIKGQAAVKTAPTAVAGLIYNGNAQALVTAGTANGGEMQYSLEQNGTYSTTVPTGENAGKYTIWYYVKGDVNHNDSEVQSLEVLIAPKEITNPTIEVASGSTYNGKAQAPTVTVKDGDTVIDQSEYTVSYSNNLNAGDAAAVTITDKDGGNYTVSGSEKFTIAKAAAPVLKDVAFSRKFCAITKQTISLASVMPANAGTMTYNKGSEIKSKEAIHIDWDVDGNGNVTFDLLRGGIGDTVTLPVTIHSTNYADTTVKVVITLTDRDTPTVKANDITVTYNGKEVSADKITGTATFDGKTVPGKWTLDINQKYTNVSDSGTKTVTFIPDDDVNYKPVTTELNLTITRKPITITGVTVRPTKEYDGTTTAVITDYGKVNGICSGDASPDIQTSGATATYTDANAGTGKTVNFSGFSLTGNMDNYILSAQPESVKADITPIELTMTGNVSAVDRVYVPGNTTVTLNGDSLTLSGMLGNETVNVFVHEGTVADADVGENKVVTYLPVLADGENGGKAVNYTISTESLTKVTVDITKAAGSVTAPAAIGDLIYNGSEQTLIKAGSSETGEVQYRLGTNGTYSTILPTAKDVGAYTVYYKVVGDKNHEDVAEAGLQVTISQQSHSEGNKENETGKNESTPAPSATPEATQTRVPPKTGISNVVKVPATDKTEIKQQTDGKEPYVSGDAGKSGWDRIKDELSAAIQEAQGTGPETVTVNMNGSTVAPGDIFDSIKGQNISVAFDLGDGIVWTVNGMDITADRISDIDFGVSMGADAGQNIPVDIINNVTGDRSSVNLTLNYDGTFGFRAVLTVNVEKSNAGMYANLFYYNPESGELEFISADEIRANGSVDLTFTHASDYTVVIDKEPMDGSSADQTAGTEDTAENPAEETTDATTQEQTSAPMIWIVLLIIVVLLAGAGAALVWRRKEEKTEE